MMRPNKALGKLTKVSGKARTRALKLALAVNLKDRAVRIELEARLLRNIGKIIALKNPRSSSATIKALARRSMESTLRLYSKGKFNRWS